MAERGDVLREVGRGQPALIALAAQLLGQLAQHLPEQDARLGARGVQLLQELLCPLLLRRLAAIDRLQQNVRVNRVHRRSLTFMELLAAEAIAAGVEA
jgi:hypothetical protein